MNIGRAQLKQIKAIAGRKRRTKFDGAAAIAVRLLAMKVPFREEYLFAEPRKYRADFAILRTDGSVVALLEYDGATHVVGGHSSGEGITRDVMKANLAVVLGFKYVRFTVDLLRLPTYFEDVVESLLAANQ